ncbi:hypothetical protein EGR_00482 [Echinococcus granulosus]|uniref:Uncharacterized protein n=1 Tax=Echinococcus granulosus TaxID=6210 RepID=W6V0W1_ECHGR|nr:hypothetical protein EGR_00482 [Echinococcus granulosus]EUB64532.1 hypothetical protein EGR_00482 [Echinococcus granulosus]
MVGYQWSSLFRVQVELRCICLEGDWSHLPISVTRIQAIATSVAPSTTPSAQSITVPHTQLLTQANTHTPTFTPREIHTRMATREVGRKYSMGYGHGAWSKSGKMSNDTDGPNDTREKYFIPPGNRIGDTAVVRVRDHDLLIRGSLIGARTRQCPTNWQGELQFRPSGHYDSPNRTNRQRTNKRPEDGETLDQNNNRNSPRPFLDDHTFRVSRLPSEPAKDQFVPKPSGHLGKYHKDVNSHANLYEKESLFKSKSHQNLSNKDEVYRKYSIPNQSIPRPRPAAGLSPQNSFAPSIQELRHLTNSQPKTPKSDSMPIKLPVSVERESISKVSDNGEKHPKGSTEEDSFFEQLTAFVKSKEKESGITHHSATKQYPGYIPSPQPEKVPPSVRPTPEAKSLAPVKKLSAPSNPITLRVAQKAGALNSSIDYEEASRAECRSADPFYHQVMIIIAKPLFFSLVEVLLAISSVFLCQTLSACN